MACCIGARMEAISRDIRSAVYHDAGGGIAFIAVGAVSTTFMPIMFFVLGIGDVSPIIWVIGIFFLVLGLAYIGVGVAHWIGVKTIISENSLTKVTFRKKKEIKKEDILFIANVSLGWREDHYWYVVYPKGYDETALNKHISPMTDPVEKSKMVQRDKRLLVFEKTKRMSELLEAFGYTVTRTFG